MAVDRAPFTSLRQRLAAHFLTRRDDHHQDAAIRDWALYDVAAQDVGRALYVAEAMIHMEINEGRDPATAVSKHLNTVRDRFAITYAKSRVALCNCGEERAEDCPGECEMRSSADGGNYPNIDSGAHA